MIGAQPLAALANSGNQDAISPALRFAGVSLARTPDTYATLVAMGGAQIAGGDLSGARRTLDRAVLLDPARPAALLQRGIARRVLRQMRQLR